MKTFIKRMKPTYVMSSLLDKLNTPFLRKARVPLTLGLLSLNLLMFDYKTHLISKGVGHVHAKVYETLAESPTYFPKNATQDTALEQAKQDLLKKSEKRGRALRVSQNSPYSGAHFVDENGNILGGTAGEFTAEQLKKKMPFWHDVMLAIEDRNCEQHAGADYAAMAYGILQYPFTTIRRGGSTLALSADEVMKQEQPRGLRRYVDKYFVAPARAVLLTDAAGGTCEELTRMIWNHANPLYGTEGFHEAMQALIGEYPERKYKQLYAALIASALFKKPTQTLEDATSCRNDAKACEQTWLAKRSYAMLRTLNTSGFLAKWKAEGKLGPNYAPPQALSTFASDLTQLLEKPTIERPMHPGIARAVRYELETLGVSEEEYRALIDHGATFHLTLNGSKQKTLERIVSRENKSQNGRYNIASMMARSDGRIVAFVTRSGDTKFHLGIDGKPQAGSIMKPHILAAVLEQTKLGGKPQERLCDYASDLLVVNTASYQPMTGGLLSNWMRKGKPYVVTTVRNTIDLSAMLGFSQNTSFVRFGEIVSADTLRDALQRAYGLKFSPEHQTAALVLGSQTLPLYHDLLGTLTWINHDSSKAGQRPDHLSLIKQIVLNGEVLYTAPTPSYVSVYDPRTLKIVRTAMQTTMAEGTGKNHDLAHIRSLIGKTGTHEEIIARSVLGAGEYAIATVYDPIANTPVSGSRTLIIGQEMFSNIYSGESQTQIEKRLGKYELLVSNTAFAPLHLQDLDDIITDLTRITHHNKASKPIKSRAKEFLRLAKKRRDTYRTFDVSFFLRGKKNMEVGTLDYPFAFAYDEKTGLEMDADFLDKRDHPEHYRIQAEAPQASIPETQTPPKVYTKIPSATPAPVQSAAQVHPTRAETTRSTPTLGDDNKYSYHTGIIPFELPISNASVHYIGLHQGDRYDNAGTHNDELQIGKRGDAVRNPREALLIQVKNAVLTLAYQMDGQTVLYVNYHHVIPTFSQSGMYIPPNTIIGVVREDHLGITTMGGTLCHRNTDDCSPDLNHTRGRTDYKPHGQFYPPHIFFEIPSDSSVP